MWTELRELISYLYNQMYVNAKNIGLHHEWPWKGFNMSCTNLNKRFCVKILQPELNFSNNIIYIYHSNIFDTDFCPNKW